jgi:hypothetical protein
VQKARNWEEEPGLIAVLINGSEENRVRIFPGAIFISTGFSGPPEIAQLFVDRSVRRITERPEIVRSLAVPAFNLVQDHGGLLKRKPIEQRAESCSCRGVRQSLLRDCANNLVAKWAISLCLSSKDDSEGRRYQSWASEDFHFLKMGDNTFLNPALPRRIRSVVIADGHRAVPH